LPAQGSRGGGIPWGGVFGGLGGALILIFLIVRIFARTTGGGFALPFGGPVLDTWKPGLVISEPQDGVSITLPAGFPLPTPKRENVPMGSESATQATYDSNVSGVECVFATMRFPPEVWDSPQLHELNGRLREHMRGRLNGTEGPATPTTYKGHQAEDSTMEAQKGGRPVHMRVRIVQAPPRLMMIVFAARDRTKLQSAAANGYFDSLAIEPREAPRRTPSTAPADPSPGLPGSSMPGLSGPGMGSPGMQPPQFERPAIPEPPRFERPTFPEPPQAPTGPFGPGGGGMGPGGMGPGGMGPGGPGFGPGAGGPPGFGGSPGAAPGLR